MCSLKAIHYDRFNIHLFNYYCSILYWQKAGFGDKIVQWKCYGSHTLNAFDWCGHSHSADEVTAFDKHRINLKALCVFSSQELTALIGL